MFLCNILETLRASHQPVSGLWSIVMSNIISELLTYTHQVSPASSLVKIKVVIENQSSHQSELYYLILSHLLLSQTVYSRCFQSS